MKIKILCTLGPASLRADVIKGLDQRGVDLFRINLSHTPPERVLPTIELVRRYSNIPISLDTQGAQVRCGLMADGVAVERGDHDRLRSGHARVQLVEQVTDTGALGVLERDVRPGAERSR